MCFGFVNRKLQDERLTSTNYSKVFLNLSMVERIANQFELDGYRQTDIYVQKRGAEHCVVLFRNVQDRMGRLTTFDSVEFKHKNDSVITGNIDELLEHQIRIKLHPSKHKIDNKLVYDMTFHLGSYTYDVEARALEQLNSHNVVKYLFPTAASSKLPVRR